jgi:hypothetical protein
MIGTGVTETIWDAVPGLRLVRHYPLDYHPMWFRVTHRETDNNLKRKDRISPLCSRHS